MEKRNKISNKIYKHLVQQKLQQKVHGNYVTFLIKRFEFTKLVESLCQ